MTTGAIAKMEPLENFTLLKALVIEIGRLQQPVVTAYQLGCMVFRAYLERSIGGHALNLKKSVPSRNQYSSALNQLSSTGIISSVSGASATAFTIIGKSDATAGEMICAIDPFCYLSHLTAMEYHGLTDRLPRTIFVSSPAPQSWKEFALEQMHKDLGKHYDSYVAQRFPLLSRARPKRLAGKHIEYKSSLHLGAYKSIQGKSLRVSTIGRTFLDMLREPSISGGMQHVIDVYTQYAKQYFRLIVDELDSHGNGIEKVRAGYILEEHCKIHDPRIDSWHKFAQRGGSRKLDPTGEYSENFSERWSLSLNLPTTSLSAAN